MLLLMEIPVKASSSLSALDKQHLEPMQPPPHPNPRMQSAKLPSDPKRYNLSDAASKFKSCKTSERPHSRLLCQGSWRVKRLTIKGRGLLAAQLVSLPQSSDFSDQLLNGVLLLLMRVIRPAQAQVVLFFSMMYLVCLSLFPHACSQTRT